MLFILICMILGAAYVFVRMIWPLSIQWWWKMLLAVLLLCAAGKFHLFHLLSPGTKFFAPALPPIVLLFGAWMFATLFLLVIFLFLTDIVRTLVVLSYRICHATLSPRIRYINTFLNHALIFMAILGGTIGLICGMSTPSVCEITLKLHDLPPEAENMTIAVVADIHVDALTRKPRVIEIVKRVNALKPNIIALVGDYVDGSVEEHGDALSPLRFLAATHGVFAVPGNHEYYSGYDAWMHYFSTLGIPMLCNTHHLIPACHLAIAGVTDRNAPHFGKSSPDVAGALAGIPAGTCIVLLSHQPSVARVAAQHGVTLQLSGHTHGGLMLGFHWIVELFNDGFSHGAYSVGNMILYVNRGSGMWNGFPVRLGIPAEITFIHLKRA